MFDALWKELGSSLNKRWVTTIFVPAFFFWMASLWNYASIQGTGRMLILWNNLDVYQQIGLSVAGLSVISLTAVLLELFQPLILRFYEGYWSDSITARFRIWRTTRIKKSISRKQKLFSELALKISKGEASIKDIAEYEKLEHDLIHYPKRDHSLMPTKLGNILRATENYSADRYGLDAVTIWPRLYFQVSKEIKDVLEMSYGQMSALIRISFLAVIFSLVWLPILFLYSKWLWAFLVALFSLILSSFCYKGAVEAAEQYSIVIRTAFDLHRFDLYKALHWPLPSSLSEESPSVKNSELETVQGQKLSLFLHRGQWIQDTDYKHSDDKE